MGQEKSTRQAEEVIERGRTDSGRLETKLLIPRRAELVSQQAEQFLNLWHRQHRFDIVGERTGVHLGHKREENNNKWGNKSGFHQ